MGNECDRKREREVDELKNVQGRVCLIDPIDNTLQNTTLTATSAS